MPTSTFYIKQGDTAPDIAYTLTPPTDLTGATIVFNLRLKGSTDLLLDRVPAEIVGAPTQGVVKYSWVTGDTDEIGDYDAEFEVTYPDGTIATYPNYKYFPVKISDDLG